jgi:EAL domain-containing protein (putative c-di-GMP-specific phosphodiesterase class I)
MSNLRTASQLSHLEALASQAEDGSWQGQFRSLRLSSVFQPVVTLSTGRVVGHEGLVRLDYADGRGATPFRFFSGGLDEAGLVELDTLCRLLHLRNFQGQAGTADSWLFLNVSPMVVASHRRHGEVLANMLDQNGFDPARVVVEIAESGVQDGDTLADAVAHYRQIGCLVAIDDYGVGLSSLTRLWSLGVDIVKLDRELLLAALARHEERRLLPGLVEFLHDCGALVLMEGVETRDEALLALEVGCDLAQGFHFAFPAPALRATAEVIPIDTLRTAALTPAAASRPDSWHLQLAAAARRLAGGATLADATAPMQGDAALLRCYWLDSDGIQRSDSLLGVNAVRPRFAMLLDRPGSDVSGRGFFARAIANPDSVQRSRAYLQRGFGVACVTLAVTAPLAGAPGVLCCDVAWRA